MDEYRENYNNWRKLMIEKIKLQREIILLRIEQEKVEEKIKKEMKKLMKMHNETNGKKEPFH